MIIVQPAPSACEAPSGDQALSRQLQAVLERQPWFSDGTAQLFVADGVVTVEGLLADDAFGQALCTAARSVAGEENVRDELIRVGTVSGCALATG